jgi:hypothetical protein
MKGMLVGGEAIDVSQCAMEGIHYTMTNHQSDKDYRDAVKGEGRTSSGSPCTLQIFAAEKRDPKPRLNRPHPRS